MSQVPVLIMTNPIWLKLHKLGVEDPGWGRRPIDQHTIAVSIHELADLIADLNLKREIQRASSTLMLSSIKQMIQETEAPSSPS